MSYCTAALPGSKAFLWTFKLYSQIKICAKIIGQPVVHDFQEAHNKTMLRLATSVSSDSSHVLNGE